MQIIATTIALLTLAVDPGPVGKTKIAVLPIEQTGVEERVISSLTAVISVELEKTGVFEVTATSDIEAMLEVERQRDALGCTEVNCLVGLGMTLGVDRILRTHVGKMGETYILDLSIINARTSRSEGRTYETVRGGPEKLLEIVPRAVAKLPRPSLDLDRALSGEQPRQLVVAERPSQWDNRPAWLVAGLGVAAMVAGGVLRSTSREPAAGNVVLGLGVSTALFGLFLLGSDGEPGTPPHVGAN